MLKSLKAGMLVAASAFFCAAPPLSAQASQIVVSCTTPGPDSKDPNGCRSSELAPPPNGTPGIVNGTSLYVIGGFWVWCQNPTTGTPYGPDCNGAMYIGEVNLATGSAVYETKSISGNSSASAGLQITVKTSDGDMTCTLTVPTSPTSGSTNTVTGSCDGVPIAFSNAVVQVTK